MITKKCAVLGLGSFGSQVAISLASFGHDVLALDIDPEVVESVNSKVSRAVVADASDKESLIAAGAKGVEVAVVGLGTPIDASTLATLHLRELGVEKVIAKAVTPDHARVLSKVGATEIVHPERDMASKLALQLRSPNIVEEIPFFEGYALFKVKSPPKLWGVSIAQSNLRSKRGIALVAVEREENGEVKQFAAKPADIIEKGDKLILFSTSTIADEVGGTGWL
ncbi:MAG: hypothetical protein C0608_02655 [Deltaproteobacteria bacterium]|nr:MAG: hypothetical protein C0608_02655 [Deltaproteobacteria bacterium]